MAEGTYYGWRLLLMPEEVQHTGITSPPTPDTHSCRTPGTRDSPTTLAVTALP